jgi:hypothetical protein
LEWVEGAGRAGRGGVEHLGRDVDGSGARSGTKTADPELDQVGARAVDEDLAWRWEVDAVVTNPDRGEWPA